MTADSHHASAASHGVEQIAFVLIPRFNMLTLVTLMEPFRIANYIAPEPLYRWDCLSFEEPNPAASNGLSVQCRPPEPADGAFDLVFVLGSWGCEHIDDPLLFRWLADQHRRGASICGVEMGLYALARAKLLDRQTVTTHWSMLAGFTEQFPTGHHAEQLFTVEERILSCAGGTAGIDLALHLIGARHNAHLVAEIMDQMLHYPARPAESPQRITHGSASTSVHPCVDRAIRIMEANLMDPVPVPELAARVGISQRQLERHFRKNLDCSVVQFSQLLRLQYARVLLTSTGLPIREVSVASGFNSLSHFSSAFMKLFGRKPSHYRQAWPDTEPAPNWPGTVFSLLESRRTGAPGD